MISLLLALVAPALAKSKIQHADVQPPQWSVTAVDAQIGLVTGMVAGEGMLVLAGQKGIAAIAPDGVVRWTTPLPEAMVRDVTVSADGVAFTAWSLSSVEDKAKALNAWAAGKLLDKFEVQGASVGFLGPDGALRWSVGAEDQHPLAPPGLAPGVVAVNTGEHFTVYDQADGSQRGGTKLPGNHTGAFAGVYDHATRGEVVAIGDAFFTSFFSFLFKFDTSGNLLDKEFGVGLTPYVDITCGPVSMGGLVVFGTTGDSQMRSHLFAMKPDMKNRWKLPSPDQQSGCGDMVRDGDRVYATSNFWAFAVDDKGKLEWESVNKKGGLYPSANRGVRYVGNFGARKTYGDLMVVGGGRMYVATSNQGHDVLTVLDADKGTYVRTIDVNETIVSLAVVGDSLAVATPAGVHFMALK